VYQGYGGAKEHRGEYMNVIALFADGIANATQPKLYADGEQARDFTHVSTIVRGIELTAEHELTGIYDICRGRTTASIRSSGLSTTNWESTLNRLTSGTPSLSQCTFTTAAPTRAKSGPTPAGNPNRLRRRHRRVCAQYQ